MVNYLCFIAYDGSDYYGYQIQKHNDKTIQHEIEKALEIIFKEKITIFGQGRTDKGVHSLNYPFSFKASLNIPISRLKLALNNLLPDAIKVNKIKKVNADFHARFTKHYKTYEYRIINSSKIDPFKARYYTYVSEPININILKEASLLFIGTHDFKNFTTSKEDEVNSFVRTICDVNVKISGKKIIISFTGDGFMQYQIRMMVGAIIAASLNKMSLMEIKNKLELKDDIKSSYKALPNGLYLKEVIYHV